MGIEKKLSAVILTTGLGIAFVGCNGMDESDHLLCDNNGDCLDGYVCSNKGKCISDSVESPPQEGELPDCEGAIDFPDPALRKVVEKTVHRVGMDIYLEDVQGVGRLDYEDGMSDVSDLTGLQCFEHLKSLVLYTSPVTDLTPLKGTVNLKTLIIDDSLVTDLSPLTGLNELTVLRIRNSPLADISPLLQMKQLEELTLNESSISDISPLEYLVNLSYLDLSSNQISDVTPLVENTGLGDGESVDLSFNPIDCDGQADNLEALAQRSVRVWLLESGCNFYTGEDTDPE
jgi:hypothetical protein